MSDYKKNAGYIGGLSLLISSVTGPGVVSIPMLFQQAGWLLPTVCFIVVAFLSCLGCLFLIESMTYFPGNEKFQRNVELTVLVHQFYGRKWYYCMHVVLFGSLQSYTIASIIAAAQNFDSFLITLLGRTCGFGITPISGFYCVTEQAISNSPFGDNYMLTTLGFLLLVVLVIPLINLDLNDNLIVQLLSLVYLFLAIFIWVIMACAAGLKDGGMKVVGSDLTKVLGNVMFNYTLANTVPSWVNTKHPRVPITKSVWYATWVATLMYLLIGLFGGAAFPMPEDSNILQAISVSDRVSAAGKGVNEFIKITWPILVLLTSIPVSVIIVRLNLVTSRICSKSSAQFWAAAFPFLAAIPFQTGAWITLFSEWTSLVFQSVCNYGVPFLVYLFLPRRNVIMQQSVLDELEFLDLDAGVKKWRDDDDDFDYVYHLPHADLNRLGVNRYNPFKDELSQSAYSLSQTGTGTEVSSMIGQSGYLSTGARNPMHKSVSGLSTMSGTSARQLMKQMLGPSGGSRNGSRRKLGAGSRIGSVQASVRGSVVSGAGGLNEGGLGGGLGGGLMVPGMGMNMGRRPSINQPFALNNKIYPVDDFDDIEAKAASQASLKVPTKDPWINDVTGELGHYRAIPYWIARKIHPTYIALVSVTVTMSASVVVFILGIKDASTG
ncbi:hypothetical protein BC832DRAFT_192613 [Gaertneriomyces semiglobifer]|nr:hypothetical protein BC832DRAFT_192613 [Gaertneriomyces semiglobifer]